MSKERWTYRQVRECNAVKIGYCETWHLLRGLEPIAYTAGIYGWNEDVYYVGNHTFISTGYHPHGTRKVPYEILEDYENQAKAIYEGNEDYNTKIAKIAKIREKCLQLILKYDKVNA